MINTRNTVNNTNNVNTQEVELTSSAALLSKWCSSFAAIKRVKR